jgi:hypothetical protein
VKVHDLSITVRTKKAHQVMTHSTDKFMAPTQMDADHQKIGRKILDLRDQKARMEHTILEKTATKPKVAMQVEVVAGAECKTNPSIACSMKETLTIRQETIPLS